MYLCTAYYGIRIRRKILSLKGYINYLSFVFNYSYQLIIKTHFIRGFLSFRFHCGKSDDRSETALSIKDRGVRLIKYFGFERVVGVPRGVSSCNHVNRGGTDGRGSSFFHATETMEPLFRADLQRKFNLLVQTTSGSRELISLALSAVALCTCTTAHVRYVFLPLPPPQHHIQGALVGIT